MKNRQSLSFLFVLLTVNPLVGQIQIHVSTEGREVGTGSLNDPLGSISGARDRIRQLRDNGELEQESVEVLIHAGRYPLTSTIEFTAQDSGTSEFPTTYRSVDGDVVISGGIELNSWEKLTRQDLIERLPDNARNHVVCTDLRSLGIDVGARSPRRLHQAMQPSPMELFIGNERLSLASWPNEGWALTTPSTKTDGTSNLRQWKVDRAIHSQDRNHLWGHGFWNHDWCDSFEPITLGDDSATVKFSSSEPLSPLKIRSGSRFRLVNLLGELDMPSEWYFDENTGLLLYWPENKTENEPVIASVLDTVLSVYDVENISFQGIRFEAARSMVVEIVGGSDVRLEDCEIAQAGNVAVHVFRGARHQIVDCNVSCTGSSAIRIEGGDRTTLTSAEHCVENCGVHGFCLDYLAGRPAIAVYGVGNVVRRNHIHHGSDSAIHLFGNEHLVEHNHIHHVCRETDDSAAIHLSYDPTYRGNVIQKNYIHDLGGFSKTGVFGIYLDDFACGTTVRDNYLRNTIRGIAIGGGHDNNLENNVIDGALASIQIDARGTTWASQQIQGEQSRIQVLCRNVLEESPVFASRYPELTQMLDKTPWIPQRNVVRSNSYNSAIGIDLQGFDAKYVVIDNNKQRPTKELAKSEVETVSSTLTELGIEINTPEDAFAQADRAKVFVKIEAVE